MIEFLDAIWPEDLSLYGELRFIDKGGQVMQRWVPLGPDRAWHAQEAASAWGREGRDTYYGVLPRTRAAGTAEATVDMTTVLWADIDAKHHGDSKLAALDALVQFPIDPSILVDSGGGYHAYWLLFTPADVEQLARPVMRGIANIVGGDAVHDSARVMRLPGSINYKRDVLVEARILRFDVRRKYRPQDFIDYIPGKRHPYRTVRGAFEYSDTPLWLSDLIRCGAPKGKRSEASFKAVIWLIRYGRPFSEIEAIFQANPEGIGAKYSERGREWLYRTWEKAMEQA